MTAAKGDAGDRSGAPIMPMERYFGRSQVAAAESHLRVMERWLEYYQNRRNEDGSRDVNGIARAQSRVDRAKADVDLQRELRRLEDDEKRARGGWHGTDTVENENRYRQAQQNLPSRTADEAGADPAVRTVCCLEGPRGATAEQAVARQRAVTESHESVLAALARLLFGRTEAQREEPWSQPCIREPDDDRGTAR